MTLWLLTDLELWVIKDLKGSGRFVYEVNKAAFSRTHWGESRKSSRFESSISRICICSFTVSRTN